MKTCATLNVSKWHVPQ